MLQMNTLSLKWLAIVLLILGTAFTPVDGQAKRGKNPEKALFGKSKKIKTKSTKTKEPKSVTKAKRSQEEKQLKLKKDYFDNVDKSKKKAYKIQSPEVQARMRQNQKNISDREKSKQKKRASSTKRGASKYKK
jgi:hypothetical protein